MQDPFPVPPFPAPAKASVAVPGSKSVTNRALAMAALADGIVTLDNALFSEDTEIMTAALQALGFEIEAKPAQGRVRVVGQGGRLPHSRASLHVGNSGTSARFLAALCCLHPEGDYVIDGSPQMRSRPIAPLADALSKLGARIELADGRFPLRIRSRGLAGGAVAIDASESSQFVSALLIVAPYAREPMEIRLADPAVRRGYIEMTRAMARQFGQPEGRLQAGPGPSRSAGGEQGYRVEPGRPYRAPAKGYRVEPDASAASYFLALPLAVGGEVEIRGLLRDSLQGDIAFADDVQRMGARVEWTAGGALCRFPVPSKGQPVRADFHSRSDTFLTAAALTPLLDGPTRIEGVAHTRRQECDRIAAMAQGLARLGQSVAEEPGALEVDPRPLRPATVATFDDHRVAMSFAILGCADPFGDARPWLRVENPLCCKKTFPGFFDTLADARESSLAKAKRPN